MRPGEVVLQRHRSRARLLWVPLVLAWGVSFAFLPFAPLAAGLSLAAILAAAVAYHRYFARKPISVQGSIERRGDDLVVVESGEARMRVPLGSVAGGFYNGLDRVVLETARSHELHVGCGDAARAEELLDLAGVSLGKRVMRIPIAGIIPPGARGCVAAIGIFLAIPFVLGGLLVFARNVERLLSGVLAAGQILALAAQPVLGIAVLFLLHRLLRTRELSIGADGLLVTGFWGRRFIPLADITGVKPQESRLDVALRKGRGLSVRVQLEPAMTPGIGGVDTSYERWGAEALAYRLRQAMARPHLSAAGIGLDRLERRGRPIADWIQDLARLGRGAGGYRAPALVSEGLAVVLEDPGSPPERRAAAAIALRALDPSNAARVEAAARTAADPDVARLLEGAAAGTIDEGALLRATRRRRVEAGAAEDTTEARSEADAVLEAGAAEDRPAKRRARP